MNYRIVLALVAGLALVVGAIGYVLIGGPSDETVPVPVASSPAPAPVTQAAPEPMPNPVPAPPIESQIPTGTSAEPTFDVVRVEKDGAIVVAGRGEPDRTVMLVSQGKTLETAKVDPIGQFVMLPKPLPPGSHTLNLAMKNEMGEFMMSKQTVTVDVPQSPDGTTLVARTEPGKATELLSPQGKFQPAPANVNGKRSNVTIAIVEAAENGTLFVSGNAFPGASVRIYLNDTYLGTANVSADGKWSIKIEKGVSPGQYKVRVDDVDPTTGKVLSRSEVTFDYTAKIAETAASAATQQTATAQAEQSGEQPSVVVPAIGTATIKRGDNLWRISQKTYGEGLRYTVIHDANRDQIRDPDLIFPGQIFVLPKLQ